MKKMIFVAAPPACGKNYVSERLCRALAPIAYFDKDELAPLLYRAFSVGRETVDMDGDFYRENLREAEYETLLNLAYSALRFSDRVLVNAPFGREVRDADFMRALRARATAMGAELILIWVSVSDAVRYARMKERNAPRDAKKLKDFSAYLQSTPSPASLTLENGDAVDRLFVFDNENEEAAERSLKAALSILCE